MNTSQVHLTEIKRRLPSERGQQVGLSKTQTLCGLVSSAAVACAITANQRRDGEGHLTPNLIKHRTPI